MYNISLHCFMVMLFTFELTVWCIFQRASTMVRPSRTNKSLKTTVTHVHALKEKLDAQKTYVA